MVFHCSEKCAPIRWQLQCTKGGRSEFALSYQTLGFFHSDRRMGFGTLVLQTNG